MKKILAFVLVVTILAACGKDEFQTKPQIKIISVSSEVLPKPSSGETYFTTITLRFTDKEGDVDSSLIFIRERLNRRNTVPVASAKFTVPEFPSQSEGEIAVNLNNNQLSQGFTEINIPGTGGQVEADTMKVSFVLADKKGNRSDTASTTIVVIR